MASSDNEGISQLPGAEASYLDQENLHFGEDFRRRADFLAIAQDRAKIRRNRLKSMVPRAAANAGIPMNDLRNRKFNGTLRNLLHPNASASRPNIPKTPTDYRNLMAESAADTAKDRQYKRFGRFFRSARDAEGSINSIAAELGELAAVTYLERRIADEGADRHIYVSPPGNEKFDVVAVIHGKLVIIEAKGGASKLGTSRVQDDRGVWHKVRQGSPMYLRYILRKDAGFRDWLKNHPDKAVRDLSNKLEAGQALDTEYHQMQAPIVQGRNGKSRVGVVTRRRLDTGGNLVTMVNEPPSTKKPRKTRPRRARARVVTVASAAAIAVPAVTAVASDADASPPTDALPDGHGVSPGQANNTSSSDGVLSFLKTKAAEFGRMLSSFKDHVTNGLNALVTMVGDAVSKVSDFVSGVIDSVGAQGVIDEAAQIWAVGQDLINYAMLLSPVGSVAEALTVAIMVIQGLVDHWDQIRAGFDWALKNV
ncbi:MAG: hypothetical protein JWN03_4838, partial [Nocardia sp.]|uniref:hypothetical protein n=1 Tax=Nocardia sp. TaxID=1821 RepID=UPI00263427E7